MKAETLERERPDFGSYFQEKIFLVKEVRILPVIKKVFKKAREDYLFEETKADKGKFIMDITWREENNFCNVFFITADLEERKIKISGLNLCELQEEEWKDKDILEAKIKEALSQPVKRSRVPFDEYFLIDKTQD